MGVNWKEMPIEELKWLAEQGNDSAMVEFGLRCIFGNMNERDREQGRIWLEKAAVLGDDMGEYGMALISESAEERVEWYKKAAAQGNVAALIDLAQCYRDGDGVAKNDEEAFKIYETLAQQGNSYAAHMIKKFYSSGGES